MRALSAANANFMPDEPMPEAGQRYRDALAVLTAAQSAVASASVPTVGRRGVPVAATNTTRRTRSFRRAPDAGLTPQAGATRFTRHRTNAMATFAARSRMPDARMAKMATAQLMAGSRAGKGVPAVSTLQLVRARLRAVQNAQAFYLRARQSVNWLQHRFREQDVDRGDGTLHMARLVRAKQRGYLPQNNYV